jgi:anti-anti-sigma regulatory factor
MTAAVEPPDLATVEALCALQLAARRLGCAIRVHDPSPELRELIALAGLDDLLLGPPGERADAAAYLLAAALPDPPPDPPPDPGNES